MHTPKLYPAQNVSTYMHAADLLMVQCSASYHMNSEFCLYPPHVIFDLVS